MHLLPHFYEVVFGPVGFGVVIWASAVVWLGFGRHQITLAAMLAITALALSIAAIGAFQLSARPYSPNRDMPLIASGLFVTFSLAAFVTATLALAIAAPSIRSRFGERG